MLEYLGHRITSQGLQPSQEKVQAIRDAWTPKKVMELRAFLCLINYYGKFLQNLSTTLSPLYKLLKKGTEWKWSAEQEVAVKEVKKMFDSPKSLDPYDRSKPLQLSCDTSPYGVGAVLTHSSPEGPQRPLAFASQTLTPVECKYSQLDKEALAVIFGVKHFHSYLFGRGFTIYSDHRPLMYIFGENWGCQVWLQPGSNDGHFC